MNNDIINKFLLVGDKFMPEMHLRQPQFTNSSCGPFTKHKQRIQKFKEMMMLHILIAKILQKELLQIKF